MKPLPENGKLLNAKLSVRLALIDSVPRENLIDAIGKALYAATKDKVKVKQPLNTMLPVIDQGRVSRADTAGRTLAVLGESPFKLPRACAACSEEKN